MPGIIFLVIVGAAIVLFYRRRVSRSINPKVSCKYNCESGKFHVKGKKREFIIKKDGNFEFLVKDGQIIACKDKRKASEFAYYRGEA